MSEKVAEGALAHANHHQAAAHFLRTHPCRAHQARSGTDYYNCGAWIDERPTYITVGENGVEIHEYVEAASHSYPAEELGAGEAEFALHADEAELFGDEESDTAARSEVSESAVSNSMRDGEYQGVGC